MGLFRSPRSRPGGSGAQEGRFRSRRVIDAVMVGRQSAAGYWQRAVGSRQRGTSSGERAAGSKERTGRRNRLRKGSAAKALIIQHLNADNCLQIRIILTTIAKNCRRQDRGKVVADQHYFGFSPTRYKLKFNKKRIDFMSKTNTLSTDSRKGLNTVPEKRPGHRHRHSTP